MPGLSKKATITIASGGTHSSIFGGDGYSLVGLILPAMDSTTIQFEVGPQNTASGMEDVFTNSGTPAAATLGTAATGAKAVAVPEEIGRLAAHGYMRLQVSAQSGGARTITGLFAQR